MENPFAEKCRLQIEGAAFGRIAKFCSLRSDCWRWLAAGKVVLCQGVSVSAMTVSSSFQFPSSHFLFDIGALG